MRKVSLKRKPLFSADTIPAESQDIIAHFDTIIAGVLNLNSKHKVYLGGAIKQLSHELTDQRTSRRLGYMNDTSFVTAYINYFMWWNLVRLTRLFAGLPRQAFALTDDSVALDIGSGPLTVPIALWLARPELRTKKITWYCLDLSQTALSSGEELYLSIAAKTLRAGEEPWRIVRVKGALGTPIRQKATFITCANVCNELTQNSDMPPDYLAKKYSGELLSYLDTENPASTLLLVEPGDPKSARFISLMRAALLRRTFVPLSPCPHTGNCPMEGKKGGKWCNFAFSTDDAPQALQRLSAKSGLPKERAVLSFVLAKKSSAAALQSSADDASAETGTPKKRLSLRITSDFIRLPELHKSGYYACSELGLVLAVDKTHINPKNGELLTIAYPQDTSSRDKKTGAILIEI